MNTANSVSAEVRTRRLRAEGLTGKAEGQWAPIVRRFRRHRTAMVSLGFLVVVLMMAALVPVIAAFGRDNVKADLRFAEVMTVDATDGSLHILGTDHLGRDYFTRLLYGARVSLSVAFVVATTSAVVGVTVGTLAGYYRGIVDTLLMRVLEFMSTIPTFPILLTLSAVLISDPKLLPIPGFVVSFIQVLMLVLEREARSIIVVVFVLTVFGWTGIARLMRGMVLTTREREYVDASRSLGATDLRLILRHVIPNAFPPIIVAYTLSLANALVAETGLSFLGLGVTDPTPTWGNMLNFATNFVLVRPWATLIPGIPVVLCSLAFNFIGDGLRDALDPRQTK